MAYVYSAMWLGIAIFLFVLSVKESKIYAICGSYFVFNSIWWFISAISKYDMFHGTAGWVYRGLTAIFLVVGLFYYFLIYRKKDRITDTKN